RPYARAVLALLLAAVAAAGLALAHAGEQVGKARAALAEGRAHLDGGRPGEAVSASRRGLALVEDIPGTRRLAGDLHDLRRPAGPGPPTPSTSPPGAPASWGPPTH